MMSTLLALVLQILRLWPWLLAWIIASATILTFVCRLSSMKSVELGEQDK